MDAERGWRIATRIALAVLGALFLVLLVTGIALVFRYRPNVPAYANVQSLETGSPFTLRNVHRAASVLLLPSTVALVVAAAGLFVTRRRRGSIALPVVAAGLVVAAGVTGYLLPWDQLSLYAVTVGSNMRGYTPILGGHDVKYVLIGHSEIGTQALSRWFWVHSVVLPFALVAILVALALKARRRADPAAVPDA